MLVDMEDLAFCQMCGVNLDKSLLLWGHLEVCSTVVKARLTSQGSSGLECQDLCRVRVSALQSLLAPGICT